MPVAPVAPVVARIALATLVAVQCLAAAAPAVRARVADEPGALVRYEPLYFARNLAYISEAGLRILDDIAVRLQTDDDAVVTIDGHVDETERVDAARRRALFCRNYLVDDRGIEPARVVVRAFGARYPAGSPRESARVVFTLSPKARVGDVRPVWDPPVARAAFGGPPREPALATGDGPGPHAVVRTGHSGAVLAVACSGDGRTLLTGGDDARAILWDRATGDELRSLEGHTGPVLAAAWAPDGRRVATGGSDGTASVWDPASGAELRRLAVDASGVAAVAFSADARFLVAGGRGGALRVFDAADGTEVQRFEGQAGAVASVAFSADGGRVVAASDDGVARVWDAITGALVTSFAGHAGAVTFATFLPGGRLAVSAGDDATARVWDAATGEETKKIAIGTRQVTAAAVSPDGRRLLAGGWGEVRAVDLESGAVSRRLDLGDDVPYALAFAPDGESALVGLERVARLVGAATGADAVRLEGVVDPSHSAATAARGRTLVAGLDGDDSRVLDLASGGQLLRLRHRGEAKAVFVSPDGAFAAALVNTEPHPFDAGESGPDRYVWRLPGGAVVEHPETYDERPPARGRYRLESASLPPGGPGLVLQDDGPLVVVRDAVSDANVFWYQCVDVELSPDGERVVTRPWEGEVEVRETATGRLLARCAGGRGSDDPFFMLDGRLVGAASDDRALRAWDMRTGRLAWRRTFPGPPPGPDDPADGTYTPPGILVEATSDGRFVLVDDYDADSAAVTRVLDAKTGRDVWSYASGLGRAESHTTPDGRFTLSTAPIWSDGPRTRVVDTTTTKDVWSSDDEGLLSADGRVALLARDGERVTARETAAGRELWRAPLAVRHAAFSDDGRFALASCGDRGLVVLDAATGHALARIVFFADGSWAALDPDGTRWDGPGEEPPAGLLFVEKGRALAPSQARALREPRMLARLLGLSLADRPGGR